MTEGIRTTYSSSPKVEQRVPNCQPPEHFSQSYRHNEYSARKPRRESDMWTMKLKRSNGGKDELIPNENLQKT